MSCPEDAWTRLLAELQQRGFTLDYAKMLRYSMQHGATAEMIAQRSRK